MSQRQRTRFLPTLHEYQQLQLTPSPMMNRFKRQEVKIIMKRWWAGCILLLSTVICVLYNGNLTNKIDAPCKTDFNNVTMIIPSAPSKKLDRERQQIEIGRETTNKQVDDKSVNEVNYDEYRLDFMIAGFPKCGTTSLLHLFDANNETVVIPNEHCGINSGTDEAMEGLLKDLRHLPNQTEEMKRGIKCPTSLWDINGIKTLARFHNRETKIIVGVRHPALFFQSYYNYRVTEMHNDDKVINPPRAETLVGDKSWRGVSTDYARFELSLMQLGKVELNQNELVTLGKRRRRVINSPFQIFLYAIDQLEDTNENRQKLFRDDLRDFLGLEYDIEQIPRSNVNYQVGKFKYPETINICQRRYKKLRKLLTRNGKKTKEWLDHKFINSADITVGGKAHFSELIETWAFDPCKS